MRHECKKRSEQRQQQGSQPDRGPELQIENAAAERAQSASSALHEHGHESCKARSRGEPEVRDGIERVIEADRPAHRKPTRPRQSECHKEKDRQPKTRPIGLGLLHELSRHEDDPYISPSKINRWGWSVPHRNCR
jgi:hypothetical protein